MERAIKQIIEWVKSHLNKKHGVKNHDNPKNISDEELKQKKNEFQTRKKVIDEYLSTLMLQFKHPRDLDDTVLDILDIIHTVVIRLRSFDKYDLTNPCVTYEEHYNNVIATYRTSIMNILEDIPNIPIEILVYYATRRAYLRTLLNEQNDLEYQSYCGTFKDDVVVLLADLGFKSLSD